MRQHLEDPVPPLASRRPDLPPGLDRVVQIALAKPPDQRYRHAGELKAALEAFARQPQAPGDSSRTNLASSGPIVATSPHLGQTMRVADQLRTPDVDPPRHKSGGMPTALLMLVLTLVVILAGTVGYLASGGRLGAAGAALPTSTTEAAAGTTVSTSKPQSPPTSTPPPAPTATPLFVVVTATPPPPTPTTPPPPTAPQAIVP